MSTKEHSTKQGLTDFIEITNNEVSKDYFEKLIRVSSAISKICKGQLSQGDNSIDDITVLKYLEKLQNSLTCMRMKYWFNGAEFTNQNSILLVDAIDSGFPARKEFHILLNDLERADSVIELSLIHI